MAMASENHSFRSLRIPVSIVVLLIPIVISLLLARYLGGTQWVHEPFHSALENSGGMIALGLGLFLIGRRAFPGLGDHYEWVVSALFCVGVLDITHSLLKVSFPFFWSRALPTLFGGIIMALVWIPPRILPSRIRASLPLLTIAFSLSVSAILLLLPEAWPRMYDESGSFSMLAKAVNVLGGMGFLAAAVFFLRAHRKTGAQEDFVFFCHNLLLGPAGLLFAIADMWGAVWWFFHVLRCIAFSVVLVYVFKVLRDLRNRQVGRLETDLRKAEGEVQEKNERLSLAMEAAQQGFWDWEMGSRQVICSPYQEILFGDRPGRPRRSLDELRERMHPEDRPKVDAHAREASETGREFQATYRVIWPETQEVRWLSSRGRTFFDGERKPLRMLGVAWDVTEAKRLEQELRNHKDQLTAVLQNIADAILVQDPFGKVLYANDAAALLLGFSSAGDILQAAPEFLLSGVEIGDEHGSRLAPERFPGCLARLGEHVPAGVLGWRIASTGEMRWALTGSKPVFKEDGSVLFAITFAHDITEQRRIESSLRNSEEMLRQSQKLEAIGRLAGGVAHDFNNLLTAVNGFSDLALAVTRPNDSIRSYLEEIRKAGQRAAGLTQQLLAFGRKQMMVPKRVNLNDLAAGMRELIQRLIGEPILLELDLDADLPEMKADPSQIEQILLNLAMNARDAMPEGGRLILRTRKQAREGLQDGFQDGPPLSERLSESVTLSVSDTGIGMDAEILEKIFEPFFTTKEFGKGFGLGLAMVHGIVAQSGGLIGVESAPNLGTTFTMRFPVFKDMEVKDKGVNDRDVKGRGGEVPGPTDPWPTPVSRSAQGGDTILVAEDESGVRRLVCSLLRSKGYKVLEAADGADALRLQEEFPEDIHLLVTDVIMPNVNGRELAKRMLKAREGIKILFMSGFADMAVLGDIEGLSHGRVLAKPFSAPDFLARVEQALEEPEIESTASSARG